MKTSYARWSVVTFKENGKVDFDENREWRWPWPDMLALEFLNVDGTATEGLRVGNQIYQSDRGIPRYVPISPSDTTWAFYAKVERKFVEHRIKEGDYFIKKKILEDVKTERSKREIKKIKELLLDEAIEKTKREMEQRFPKPVETEANTE